MSTLLAAPNRNEISTWQIDPAQSQISFTFRQFVITTVRASFREVSGVVRVTDDDPRVHIDVRLPVAGLRTGASWRDARLRSPAFFDAVSYPTISFLGRRIRGDHRGMFSVDGNLTIHGTTRDVILRATAKQRRFDDTGELERATFHATTTIDRRDFGVVAPTAIERGGLVFGHALRVDINLDLIPRGAGARWGRGRAHAP